MSTRTIEYGDFQTPPALAKRVCELLARRGIRPAAVVEPTCGIGNLLFAALDGFPTIQRAIVGEINPTHVRELKARSRTRGNGTRLEIHQDNAFEIDWTALLAKLPGPILVLGNPPWVTSARIGALRGANLPAKTNAGRFRGLDAKTGKSNFDISEWLLVRLLDALKPRGGTLAMLCKTTVARKVLARAWEHGPAPREAEIHAIEASTHFGASVDACLFVCDVTESVDRAECRVYQRLGNAEPTSTLGFRNGRLIADAAAYDEWGFLETEDGRGAKWRSGIKHDCAKVMELREEDGQLYNGLGEHVDLESDFLYPLRKSSDLSSGGRSNRSPRWMLVTQITTGEDTGTIRERAPRTWAYLQRHAEALDRRASTIYHGRPRFAVFGVGSYTFAPWKVAISGLYKSLCFAVVGPWADRPVVLDDTAYFLPCRTEEEATRLAALLNSPPARGFYSAFIFWDAKRPVTAAILGRLDLSALSRE